MNMINRERKYYKPAMNDPPIQFQFTSPEIIVESEVPLRPFFSSAPLHLRPAPPVSSSSLRLLTSPPQPPRHFWPSRPQPETPTVVATDLWPLTERLMLVV